MEATRVADLVTQAHQGDADAWEELVDEYSGMVTGITRRFRLNEAQRADAVQLTWLSLVEHVGDIRQPERLAGWLATTARRACLASIKASNREHPFDPTTGRIEVVEPSSGTGDADCPERALLEREQCALVSEIMAELPTRHRILIEQLMSSPSPCYREISDRLGVPVGSIGPTRQRILRRMRAQLAARGLEDLVLS